MPVRSLRRFTPASYLSRPALRSVSEAPQQPVVVILGLSDLSRSGRVPDVTTVGLCTKISLGPNFCAVRSKNAGDSVASGGSRYRHGFSPVGYVGSARPVAGSRYLLPPWSGPDSGRPLLPVVRSCNAADGGPCGLAGEISASGSVDETGRPVTVGQRRFHCASGGWVPAMVGCLDLGGVERLHGLLRWCIKIRQSQMAPV